MLDRNCCGSKARHSERSRFLREIGPHRPTATCSRSIRQNVAVLAVRRQPVSHCQRGYAGRFRQIAGEAPIHSRGKSQYLNALNGPLPHLTSSENVFHYREASRADGVFGTHSRQARKKSIFQPSSRSSSRTIAVFLRSAPRSKAPRRRGT